MTALRSRRKLGPRRKVVEVILRGGGSILNPGLKHHWWQLRLECGHVVERRIRWKQVPNPRRGWAALHHGPSLNRLPDESDEPKHAHCEECR